MMGGDWKAMFKAIEDGDLELVKVYLKGGIDPNYQHPEFLAAPLVEAIRYSHLEIAKLLLDNGANPVIKEIMGGDTPLSVATHQKDQAAILLLKPYIEAI